MAEDYKRTRFTKEQPDRRFQQVLFAKNKAGYHNLAKLSTEANTVGLYGQYARVGRELIAQYRENTRPAIIQIPGVSGNTGAGVNGVKKTVEQAVGSDILFGGVS